MHRRPRERRTCTSDTRPACSSGGFTFLQGRRGTGEFYTSVNDWWYDVDPERAYRGTKPVGWAVVESTLYKWFFKVYATLDVVETVWYPKLLDSSHRPPVTGYRD